MAKKMTKKIQPKQVIVVVTFNAIEKIMNVFTGQQEDFYRNTRNGMIEYNWYLVKMQDQEYGTIEYDIYPKTNMRFDPETELTLHDYLYQKVITMDRSDLKARYEDVLFTCPDTGESFTINQIIQDFHNDIKAEYNYISKQT